MPSPYAPRPFRPAWWLPGPHAQTIAGRYLRPAGGLAFRRERLETPDGDFVDLDWVASADDVADDAPAVVVVHGLEGSASSTYVLEACRQLGRNGVRAAAMNFRSCSGEMNRAPRFYHAGETEDLARVLEHVRGRFPRAPLGAMGFSLGGNVLLKYLGERGEAALPRAAAAVSVPFDLAAGSVELETRPMGRVYQSVLLRSLRRKVREKQGPLAEACDPRAALAARSFRDFDDAATARLHGFRGVDDYYASSSSAGFLAGIRVPTLLVHSADDPFLPEAAIPREAVAANPCLAEAFTDRGGHVGFVGGPPWAPRFWAEEEAARFLASHLGGGGR